ncbi:MAG: hypothetical protein IT462_14735 [Planctomycetes bacterium]|nr:hypothetical protein [Planctomycetota bacterium]
MNTRILALPALLLLVAAALPVRTDAQVRPAQFEVNKWIDRFLTDEPDQFERDELLKKLSRAGRDMIGKNLKAAITTDGKRPFALQLAAKLRVGGLFDTAKKFADGDDDEFVAKLALSTLDKGAANWAVDRWKTKEVGSPSWSFIDDAFKACPVPIDTIKQFKEFAASKSSPENKLMAAIEIMAWQLGVKVPEVPADLIPQWDKLKAAWEADSKVFPVTGIDMFTFPDLGISGTRVLNNYRMSGSDCLTFEMPDEWDAASFTINMQIRWTSGSGFKFAFMSEKTGNYLYINAKGEWSLPTAKGDLVQKAKANDWTKVTLKVVADSKESRSVKITIDEKEFHFGNLPCEGPLTYLTINAFETKFTLAAMEWLVTK